MFSYHSEIGISGVKNGGGLTSPLLSATYFRNTRSFNWDTHLLRHEMGHLKPWMIPDNYHWRNKCIMNFDDFAGGYYQFCKDCKKIIKAWAPFY